MTAIELCEARRLFSTYFVSTNGSDQNPGTVDQPVATIQHALDLATNPGDIVQVRAGTYHEMVTFHHSGSAEGGMITLQPFPGENVVLTGEGAASNDVGFGNDMIQIVDQSYIRVQGFEITNPSTQNMQDDSMGVRVQGSGSHVEILNNTIHDILGKVTKTTGENNTGFGGAAIQVYGSSIKKPFSDITISGNTIYNCEPGDSETETVTLNGNVTDFKITDNTVHDCNNIGIVMIGGEANVFKKPKGTQNLPVARNGLCAHNTVYNIHANYGGGFAAGIYIDGGKNITVSNNTSYQNDMGLEVAAENRGYVATGNIVQDNIIYNNTQAGLSIGGATAKNGRARDCVFINNTVTNNDTAHTGAGQLQIQFAGRNKIENNIFTAAGGAALMGSAGAGNKANVLDYNLYWTSDKAEFNFNASSFDSLPDYQKKTKQETHSLFADPMFVGRANADFRIGETSPASGAGTAKAGLFDSVDYSGKTRTLPPNLGAN